MANPVPGASFPIPPPLFKAPFGTVKDSGGSFDLGENNKGEKLVYLTTTAIGFLTELWAAIQGGGGIIPSLLSIAIPAAGVITAYDVVSINAIGQAIAPNITVVADGLGIIGIATTAASGSGLSINVQPIGVVSNPVWTWTPGAPVWCGAGGVLTQTAPTGAGNWVRKIGVAVSATDMEIQIGELVELT